MASSATQDYESFRGSLARRNAIAFGFFFAVIAGASLFLATLILVMKGGVGIGRNLSLLNQYFPGYSVTVGGAFIGLLWAVVTGFLLATPTAWLYYRGVFRQVEKSGALTEGKPSLNSTVRHVSGSCKVR